MSRDSPSPADPKPRKLPRRPASALAERWTRIDGVDVFYRESPTPPPDARVLAHLHGFGLSGRYLLPTAERLADEFHTFVPDLPGFGRSGKRKDMLDIPDLAHSAADFFDDRGVEKVSLVGNSMGCPVIIEFAHHYPERIERAVLVSPAGGLFNQPLRRAIRQLSADAPREPVRMAGVAVPDYVRFGVPSTMRLFRSLTQYPTLQRLLEMHIPTLVVLGERDPLLPHAHRIDEVASQTDSHVLVVLVGGAAHAINFSHPEQLAHVIRLFMDDKPIVNDPEWPGHVRLYEVHRGKHHPPSSAQGVAPDPE
ncbi:alpha/beta fold hydrolase [Microbacterium allomyrinae]|jgi:pimeloyl-ACP methyl ester carboxylesterase|uniref:Alpha/beta fold hydrolase n=1 Tax=Microbacterium allomyrinae TaxID=2830666 RepID=A0A9X1S3A3_9MICO|nr:alpha/beta fold hydrolase [Microbacterium allomyrinae]MCC2032292.1 alpha/beta fold hydrolase [Microbacterium allomyrinae]